MPHKLTLVDLLRYESIARNCLLERATGDRLEGMERTFTPSEARALAFLEASIHLLKSTGGLRLDSEPFAIQLEEADSTGIDHHDWDSNDDPK